MPKQKSSKRASAAAASSDAISDARFANFTTDPRYRLPSKKHTRTKIDKRFSRMLTDEDFTNTATVDRYGRKVSKSGKKQALERLYQPADSEEDDESDGEVEKTKKKSIKNKIGSPDSENEEESDLEVEDDEVIEEELKKAKYLNYDAARGGGFSSSEDEDEDDDEGGVDLEEEEEGGEIFPDIQESGVPLGDVSKRIAVVNLDWDNIRASDLMAVFSSFVRAGGRIEKISVYPSEFGRERMEREEMEGPPKEIFAKQDDSDEDEDQDDEDEEDVDEKIKNELIKEDDGQEFDSAQLRQYQLERLRYYYAVIICSDEETATKIYEATDGTEYLSSANFFDLRFIPDGVEFDEKPRDECTTVPAGYKPTEFVTDALQHSKVKLTWDAEDTTRKDVIKKAFSGSRTEIGENDLKAYLGSDSSDNDDDDGEEEEEEKELEAPKLTKKELARQKMRAALGLSTEPEPSKKTKAQAPVGDIEVTFTPGLSSTKDLSGGKSSVFLNEPEETTAEKYVRKERERKARRKERAKAIREGRDPDAIDDAAEEIAEPEDLGFDDPFFATDEKAKEKVKKDKRKEDRKKRHEEKEAEEAAKEEKRAELELLMEDNNMEDVDHLDHFDIKEIARAEKLKKKVGKKSKKSKKDEQVVGGKRGGLQEDFEMNVADPRFQAVFEENEFAIDPSNPSFKGTAGMKKLLEEGRKRRKVEDMDEPEEIKGKSKKRKGDDVGKEVGLSSLVDMVKKKARR